MEDLRKKLADSSNPDLFVLKGGPARRVAKPVPMASPDAVITISSSESSPSGASGVGLSHPVDHGFNESDRDSVNAQPRSPKKATGKIKKRLIWSDDEDEQPFLPLQQSKSSDSTSKVEPIARNAVPKFPGKNPKPRDGEELAAIELVSSDEEQPVRIPPPQIGSKFNQVPFKNQPTIVKIPTNSFNDPHPSSDYRWETFNEPAVDHLYDPRKTAAEAERDLKELLSSSMNDTTVAIDIKDVIVDGFQEGIKLLPHQVIGRKWMAERESGKKAGGILADDMGLGKTIQTLTRIVDGRPRKSDKHAGYAASTLVVCPLALVSQWASEIRKMAVGLRVIEHHGPSRTKDPEVLRRAHIVITTYSVLSSEHGAYRQPASEKATSKPKSQNASSPEVDSSSDDIGPVMAKRDSRNSRVMDALFRVKWWRIVLDEAHNIKNCKTKGAEACCALEGKFRWALTGTPMQNNVEELYSLLKFLRIRPLHDWETFNNQINKPVKSGRSIQAMKKLQVVLKAIMLRRKKDSILNGKPLIELPDRNVDIVHCEFDPDEREFYESIATKVESTLDKFRQSGDIAKNYTSVLVLLLRLRQACNHPSLVSKDFLLDKESVEPQDEQGTKDADELTDLLGQLNVSFQKCQMCQQPVGESRVDGRYCLECENIARKSRRKSLVPSSSSLPPDSAKIRMTLQILRKIRECSTGEKTIIFSQFTSMLDLVQPFLQNGGIRYVRYDGSMRKDQREESLRAIREDKNVTVILISFKAGNTGLNLTACNNVILLDLWWNPALEDQAFDRAHRFGQSRPVNIYKLTIAETVEERILALQEKKRALAAAALSGDKLKNSRLGLEELMALFRSGGHEEED